MGELHQKAVNLALGGDIDATCRLVDDEEPRAAAQPLRQNGLLLVAPGQRRDRVGQAQVLDAQPCRPLGGKPVLSGTPHKAEALQASERGHGDVALDRQLHDEAL